MPKILRRLKLLEASLVDRPANPHAAILLWKRADPTEGEPVMPLDDETQRLIADMGEQIGDLTKLSAELTKQKEESDAQAAKAMAELDRIKKGANPTDASDEEDAILKGMSEPVRERFEQLRKQAAEYEARLAKQEERSAIEDCEKKIAKRFPNIGRAAHFAPSYYKITKALGSDEVVLWDRLLAQASEALGRLGEERGRSGTAEYPDGDGGADALQAIEARGREIRKHQPLLSKEQAEAMAMEQDPKLYEAWRKERII